VGNGHCSIRCELHHARGASASSEAPLRVREDAVRISVRVMPRAGRTAVGGRRGDALVVKVGEPAVDGRANAACLDAVAAAFGVRRRDVALVQGATSRSKVLDVLGRPEEELRAVLADLTADIGKG